MWIPEDTSVCKRHNEACIIDNQYKLVKKRKARSREMAQRVKSVTHKPKDPSLIPGTLLKKPDIVICVNRENGEP